MTVLLGFAALTVDVGAAYNTRNDLQKAADAAALAAAAAYTTDTMMLVRMESGGLITDVVNDGTFDASLHAIRNPSLGTAATYLGETDIEFGWLDLTSATSGVVSTADATTYNAVQVVARRTAESANGPMNALFSKILGNDIMEIQATATASFDDRVAGFDTGIAGGLLPFTIHEDQYEAFLAAGNDDYSYDPDLDSVSGATDGIPEINLFPHNNVPGNFGLLNIGTPNQGAVGIQEQIENGISPEDFEAETGSEVLTFWDNGAPATYTMTGDTGISATLETSVELHVGDVVGYFLHNHVIEEGSNSQYTITRMVFGRVMDVKFNANPVHRGLFIQPTTYSGGGIILSADAPSSGGNSGRLVLSR
jgi:Flp pilus assembly protein TadG